MCLCLICSQNKTLQTLLLYNNQIGAAGAASIGDALAYVTLSPLHELSFKKTFPWRHPIFWIDNGHYQVNILFIFQQCQFNFANAGPRWCPRRKSDRRHRCHNSGWCFNVRYNHASRNSTAFLYILFLIRALSRCYFVCLAAKTRLWRHYTSTITKSVMQALPRSVVPWRTSLFRLCMNFHSKRHFLGATRFFPDW